MKQELVNHYQSSHKMSSQRRLTRLQTTFHSQAGTCRGIVSFNCLAGKFFLLNPSCYSLKSSLESHSGLKCNLDLLSYGSISDLEGNNKSMDF